MRTPTFWHRFNLLSALLAPLSLPYLLGAWMDRMLTKPQRAAVPIISVGNVTAGGAGKTPATLALIPLLKHLGESPHILTRGYGGVTRTPHQANLTDDWRKVGDEPLLLAHAAPCWVGHDRLASSVLAAEHGASLAIADDALQHHRLHKDISLLIIDGAYGVGNHLPLPAGPLREPFSAALARCHAVILIGEDMHGLTTSIRLPIFAATLEPVGDVSFLHENKWLAFAGLARPRKFFDTLKAYGANVIETESFADHYPYHARDIKTLLARTEALGAKLITTEKDAVKIPPVLRGDVAVLKVSLRFADEAAIVSWLKEKLDAARIARS